MMSLKKILEKKPLFYPSFDATRMPRVFGKIDIKFPKIIHIVGTNGKGSSGRFLALMLKELGFSVGHYTSPHIFELNERFWLDGKLLSDEILEENHEKLKSVLSKEDAESLSFFEYLTLLAGFVFMDCDFVIFEAGLGGEYDATNVFSKKLSIITPVGLDHQELLGESLKEIATTKINSISTTTIISSKQEKITKKIAKKIAREKEIVLINSKDLISKKTQAQISKYIKKENYPKFFKTNLQSAYAGIKALGLSFDLKNLPRLDLRGRFERYKKNLLLDLGHNELAAKEIIKSLPDGKINLIYNAFDDKDVEVVLKILAFKIKYLHIIDFNKSGRKDAKDKVVKFAKECNIKFKTFDYEIKEDEFYLVFGSFAVVEQFLKVFNAR